MFKNTKNHFAQFKSRNKQYSDEGKRRAKELLRRREDGHEDEHGSNADEYAHFWKDEFNRFRQKPLGKQIGISFIIIIVIILIVWGWLG